MELCHQLRASSHTALPLLIFYLLCIGRSKMVGKQFDSIEPVALEYTKLYDLKYQAPKTNAENDKTGKHIELDFMKNYNLQH